MSTVTQDVEVREVLSGVAQTKVMVRGHGEPVLFLHSQYGWEWSDILEGLSSSFTVYAPELAAAEDHLATMDDVLDLLCYVNDVVDALEIAPVHVIGQSLGAALACELAALNRDRVRRLALLAPLGIWLDSDPVADLIGEPVETRAARLFVDPQGKRAARWTASLTDPNRVYYKAMRAYTHFYWPLPDVGLHKRAQRISAPTLIVRGDADGLISERYAARMAQLIAGATVTTVNESGHLLEESSADVVRLLVAHLQTH